jgi:quercetin dioxygenase-like cupin family protein
MRTMPMAVVAMLISSLAWAQAPAATKKGLEKGVNPVRLMDRAEVRVLRTELQPGITRGSHKHDDVRFHLFLPLTAGIELTVGDEKPVMAEVGQAYFILKGTPHGFRNTGTITAMAYEVFVKDSPAAVAGKNDALSAVLALLAANAQK